MINIRILEINIRKLFLCVSFQRKKYMLMINTHTKKKLMRYTVTAFRVSFKLLS